MASEKENFTLAVYDLIKLLEPVMEKAPEIVQAWNNNGYNNGGADEMLDTDIENLFAFSAADLTSAITMFTQLNNFFGNVAVTTGDRAITMNKLRFGKK